MINSQWHRIVFSHLLPLIGGCLLLGVLTQQYAWMLLLGVSAYLAWNLKQLLRLQHWLKPQQPDQDQAPPESHGLWGEVFDNLYNRQRREQRQRDRLQAVIDRVQESTAALKDAVILLDSDDNLQWWNLAAQTLLGLKSPQDSGQPITNLVRNPRFKEYLDSGQYQEPLELPAPVGDHRQLQLNLTRYGKQEHLMLVRDVTRLHQLEQMRKDFVANVSHELRTPLTVICGYLETLLDNPGSLDPRWLRALKQMQQQGGRMQNLLNDLLLLAKLEATDYPSDYQAVAVEPLLHSIRQDALALSASQQHQISLSSDPQLKLKGCETELRSAFSNLVFNAVKYSPAQSEIRIRCWADAEGAHLCVEDDGPGIEARHLSRLTERFYRVDSSRASNTGGTGLGLAIVKHVLLRHRAQLAISSTLGKGSRFTCQFPNDQLISPSIAS